MNRYNHLEESEEDCDCCYENNDNLLEYNYISLLSFIKEEAEKKDKLERLLRKSFKLTKLHRESNSLFE